MNNEMFIIHRTFTSYSLEESKCKVNPMSESEDEEGFPYEESSWTWSTKVESVLVVDGVFHGEWEEVEE